MAEETTSEIQEQSVDEESVEKEPQSTVEEAPIPKKRGRPPGAKNKPKTKIIETPIVPTEPVVMKSPRAAAPEPRMFTREEVQSLLLDSCRLQEQRLREEKRERYSAFFRRQKWTQS
jgi:hypothetical protein